MRLDRGELHVCPQVSATPLRQQRYQSPDLWLLDATGAKADAVHSVRPKKAPSGSAGCDRSARPGQPSLAAVRLRGKMLHSRYKSLLHPSADQSVKVLASRAEGAGTALSTPAQPSGRVRHVVQPWNRDGPGSILQRLRCVQQRRMNLGPQLCD